MSSEILGSGLAFPLQVDARGGLALARGEEDIEQAIELILATAPGEREMRPEFGCAVHDLVFDTVDAAMIGKLETAIRGALDRWEPRIEVEDLRVRPRRRRRRPPADHDRVPHPRDQPRAQPGLSVLRDPRGGRRVRLPAIELDDRRFQDLVSEARLRINRACPEWTEHNVSDPGITLIELFAWMTEMTIYRLNRVPDKLHVALMELLGIRLDGPTGARTSLRFRLSAPADRRIDIAGGATEVGTLRTATEEAVVFQVDEDFVIPAARPAAYVVLRGGKPTDIGIVDGTAKPTGPDQLPFGGPPEVGDALHLGFHEPLGAADHGGRHGGVDGARRRRRPRRPAAALGGLRPATASGRTPTVLEDLTGGFNYGSGTVEVQCPPHSAVEALGRPPLHWLRCRIDDKTRGGKATKYTHPPEIYSITAAPVGALLPASHSARAVDEIVGTSDGTPGPGAPAAQRAGAQAADGRDARGPGSRVRRLGALGAARQLRGLDGVRPPLLPRRRVRASSSSGRRSARPTAAGRSTAPCRRRAASCA